jgi:hypothetical protein
MAAKPTSQPVASAARPDTVPAAHERSGPRNRRSPAARLAGWLRGDRYMVDAYPPVPPGPAPDAHSHDDEH